MNQKAVWTLLFKHEMVSDPPDEWDVVHYCVLCWAKRNNMTVEEAKADIRGAAGDKKRHRAGQFSRAMEAVREDFEMADVSNHQVRKMVRKSDLHEVLQPLAQYILLKIDLMQKVCQDAAKHTELVDKLGKVKN